MDKKKTILMVIPNLNFGGAQRVFYNMSIELARNYRVIECVFNFESGHAFKTGNEVVSLEVSGSEAWFGKIWQLVRRVRQLKKVKRLYCPDVCISHLEGADLVNVLSQGNEVTVSWLHGSKKHDANISGLQGLLRHYLIIPFVLRRVDKIVSVSQAIKLELIKFYGVDKSKIECIYNFFDVEDISQKSASPINSDLHSIYEKGPVIIFSGRLTRQKNIYELITWFASYRKSNHAKLVIVGDGELRGDVIMLAKKLGLRTYHPWGTHTVGNEYELYFLGFQYNPYQFIRRADLFILPSLWEGFPMVLGEAMACRVPVIAANCPTGPSEMLDEQITSVAEPYYAKHGVLMPLLKPSTYLYWTEAVKNLLTNNSLSSKYAQQASRRAEYFSMARNQNVISNFVAQQLHTDLL